MYRVIILLLLFTARSLPAQERYVVFQNVNVFTGEKYLPKTNLAIKDGAILAISDSLPAYPGARVIDGTGKTLIPPLVNAHVHLWLPFNLRQSLPYGIFANLDMSLSDVLANQLRLYNDSLAYAAYYSANVGATVPGGHGTQFGPVPTINDTLSPQAFVRDRVRARADYIKILKEPALPTLSSRQTREVIRAAHRHGKIAVAHVSRLRDALELAAQGVDGFVHIWWDRPATEEQWRLLKKQGLFIVPTLSVIEKGLEALQAKGSTRPVLTFGQVLQEVKKAHSMGIPILCGTDSPNFMLNYTDHYYDEMLLLFRAGLSGEAVLRAATLNIYRAFRLPGFGVLQAGAPACFILVEGNPVLRPGDIKNSKRIFKNGVEIPDRP